MELIQFDAYATVLATRRMNTIDPFDDAGRTASQAKSSNAFGIAFMEDAMDLDKDLEEDPR
jgi:hypothetical protein